MRQSRIECIDLLKGIAIITIVWRHIADLGIVGHVNCLFLQILNSFHVPLFFFISGIFAFRHLDVASVKSIWAFLKNKFIRLIFPFIVFGGLYHFTVESLANFPGYWFLPALFYCMVFGLIYKVFEKQLGGKYVDVIMIIASWGLCCIVWALKFDIPYYLGALKQFPFFMMGYYFNKYNFLTAQKTDKEIVWVMSLAGYVIAFALMYSRKMIFNFPAVFSLILILNYTFRCKQHIPSWINYVGQHSLEIYVLHFFFIPSLFPIGQFLLSQSSSNQNFIVLLLLCLLVSVPIIFICLFVSSFIRKSSWLGFICFGIKNRK